MIGMISCQSNYTDLLFSLGWIWALNSLLDEDCRTAGYNWGKTIAGVCLQWNLQVCMGGLDSHHSHQWSSLKNSLVLPQAIVIREHPYEYRVRCALACRVIIHRQWFPWPLTPTLLCINWNIVITHARIHDWYGQDRWNQYCWTLCIDVNKNTLNVTTQSKSLPWPSSPTAPPHIQRSSILHMGRLTVWPLAVLLCHRRLCKICPFPDPTYITAVLEHCP